MGQGGVLYLLSKHTQSLKGPLSSLLPPQEDSFLVSGAELQGLKRQHLPSPLTDLQAIFRKPLVFWTNTLGCGRSPSKKFIFWQVKRKYEGNPKS